MDFKIFNALPSFLSSDAAKVLLLSQLSESDGRLSWPRVVMYEYANEWGERIKTALPPKNEIDYFVIVLNQEAYDYLNKTGWMYDERHTGAKYKVVDNRKAPGA